MRKALVLVVICFFSGWMSSIAQDDPYGPIIKAIQASDAKSLAAGFSATVELRLADHENTCSASQGEMIMKDFFKNYPVDSFSILEKGITDPNTKFAIGEYISGTSKFQVYINLHREKDAFLIQKIKFDQKK
jgi:hypothetical protein